MSELAIARVSRSAIRLSHTICGASSHWCHATRRPCKLRHGLPIALSCNRRSPSRGRRRTRRSGSAFRCSMAEAGGSPLCCHSLSALIHASKNCAHKARRSRCNAAGPPRTNRSNAGAALPRAARPVITYQFPAAQMRLKFFEVVVPDRRAEGYRRLIPCSTWDREVKKPAAKSNAGVRKSKPFRLGGNVPHRSFGREPTIWPKVLECGGPPPLWSRERLTQARRPSIFDGQRPSKRQRGCRTPRRMSAFGSTAFHASALLRLCSCSSFPVCWRLGAPNGAAEFGTGARRARLVASGTETLPCPAPPGRGRGRPVLLRD